ncbi:MAG TPA: NUDIX domain-containing protein [Terriglobales bacterium]|nr:NUDIX domain-containing protein [Terriglobales bacterium]
MLQTVTSGESNCALVEVGRIVHSAAMRVGESGLAGGRLRLGITKFFPAPKPGKRNECEQVAAICYRIRSSGIEFLLIRTRSGRWTFPKGGIEPGLTHAQAAALEAFEEAGVHGRMEEASFTHYIRRKHSNGRSSAGSAKKGLVVNAHLCEVLRLGAPQESDRDPTWFSPQRAKKRLQQDRTSENGAEFARVVDLAVTRIQRFRNPAGQPSDRPQKDALQKVQFEPLGMEAVKGRAQTTSFVEYIRGQRRNIGPSAAIKLAVRTYLGQVLRNSAAQEVSRNPPEFSAKKTKPRLDNRPSGIRQLCSGTNVVAVPPETRVIEIDNYPRSNGHTPHMGKRKKEVANNRPD